MASSDPTSAQPPPVDASLAEAGLAEAGLVASDLAEADLGDAEALVREAGWNQTAADWRVFIAFGKVFALRERAGRVIATAATLPYQDRCGWISMVLVAGAWRRRGLATRLLRSCIEGLAGANLVPVLDATPDGRAVYRGLGFIDAWGFTRMERGAAEPPADRTTALPTSARPEVAGCEVLPVTDEVWRAVCTCDAAAFGADRTGLLTGLLGRAPGAEFAAIRNGRVAGFVLGRDGRIARQIGPLVADDEPVAAALLARALAATEGPAFIDVPDARTGTLRQLEAAGFRPQRGFTRMLYRRDVPLDDGTRTFAVAGPEFG
jgi:N-acetylglutamate synthase-like GNAT family acetyltransferase